VFATICTLEAKPQDTCESSALKLLTHM